MCDAPVHGVRQKTEFWALLLEEKIEHDQRSGRAASSAKCLRQAVWATKISRTR